MLICEIEQRDVETGFINPYPTEDDYNVRKPTDTRKPKLTLKHINKLKRIRAVKELEMLKKSDILSIMYALPDESGGGDFGGGGFQ